MFSINDEQLRRLGTQIKTTLDDYLNDDYVCVAAHTNSIMIAANQAILDVFGYEENEVIGMNAWRLFSMNSSDVIMQHLIEKSEEPYQVTALKKDKTEFEVELKGIDIEISGEPVRIVLLKEV